MEPKGVFPLNRKSAPKAQTEPPAASQAEIGEAPSGPGGDSSLESLILSRLEDDKAQDVVLIETQMVQSAQWVNENLPSDSLLAVQDIGAIGYFTQNPLIDLAGLVTPDVLPFIRDEAKQLS